MKTFLLTIFCFCFSNTSYAWDAALTPGIGSFINDSSNSFSLFTQKIGVEYMLGMPNQYEYGIVFDAVIASRKKVNERSGLLVVLGPQFRAYLPSHENFFWDALLGVAPTAGGLGERTGLAIGVGAGHRFMLNSKLYLSPHLAYRQYFVNGQSYGAAVLSAIISIWNP